MRTQRKVDLPEPGGSDDTAEIGTLSQNSQGKSSIIGIRVQDRNDRAPQPVD
jgi:hypothetical protein